MKTPLTQLGQTPTLISIFTGSLLVIWQLFCGGIPPSVQMCFFAFFIFLTGIPHGALDHLVEKETAQRHQNTFNFLSFLVKYLATMLCYALLWWLSPTLSLYFFLLISAWHFGETDLSNAPNTRRWHAAQFVFGILILGFLLFTHGSEITPMWSRLVRGDAAAEAVWLFLITHQTILLIGVSLIFGLLFLSAYQQLPTRFEIWRFTQLAIILTLCYFLPLLPAFTLYFCGWHALCSFHAIENYLTDGNTTSAKNLTKGNLSVWFKSLPFTLLALIFLISAILFWFRYYNHYDPLPLTFIFLSLITLPHLDVMYRMNKKLSDVPE